LSFLDQITVIILTYNEASNIRRTLDALTRFPEIVVLDSGSTDGTAAAVALYPNARIAVRPFDSHAAQWNYGLNSCGIHRPWVLSLDADYRVSADLAEEIAALQPEKAVGGYRCAFRYCIFGRPLSATLYPPVVALFRREHAHYVQEGHTQRVTVDGVVGHLSGRIDHDDRKPLERWVASQQRYAELEANHILSVAPATLKLSDRIRLLAWPAPLLVFLYALIVKRCIFDGLPGWLYVLQRTLAEMFIALEILDRRLRRGAADCNHP
jgi:glycosyltransferase involved in cell wall biosynthesis